MKQVHLYVSGFVQGVGYRVFVRKKAQKLGLTGWVRNLPDRRVEAVVQGDEEIIKKLIKICEHGPFFSEVKNIMIDWEEVGEEFEKFIVIRD